VDHIEEDFNVPETQLSVWMVIEVIGKVSAMVLRQQSVHGDLAKTQFQNGQCTMYNVLTYIAMCSSVIGVLFPIPSG